MQISHYSVAESDDLPDVSTRDVTRTNSKERRDAMSICGGDRILRGKWSEGPRQATSERARGFSATLP